MIAQTEDWLVTELGRVLGARAKVVESAPGRWSGEFLKRMVRTLPAIYVVWMDATADPAATDITLRARWIVYVVVGHDGMDQRQRRRGTSSQAGAYALTELVAATLHSALVPDQGRLGVERIENLYAGPLEAQQIALYAVTVSQIGGLDVDDAADALDDFLRAGTDFTTFDQSQRYLDGAQTDVGPRAPPADDPDHDFEDVATVRDD